MMKLRLLAAALIGLLAAACSAFAEDTSFLHISEAWSAPSLHFVIDADVMPVEAGTRLPVYETDYAPSTKEAWLAVFFGDPHADVTDSFAGKSQEALLSARVTDADRERAYSLGNIHTRYQACFCALTYSATARELIRNIPAAVENAQAEGVALSPEQARAAAQGWIDRFSSALGWKNFQWAHTYALPPGDGRTVENENYVSTGLYLVEYERFLNGIPVARDVLPGSETEGDLMQFYLDGSGVLRIDGVCRSYTEQGSAPVRVSLEEAIGILKEHADFVPAFPDSGGFILREAGLCYRLVPELREDDPDYHAVMAARPAWRFASGICRNQTNVFVLYIDAETGEVLD